MRHEPTRKALTLPTAYTLVTSAMIVIGSVDTSAQGNRQPGGNPDRPSRQQEVRPNQNNRDQSQGGDRSPQAAPRNNGDEDNNSPAQPSRRRQAERNPEQPDDPRGPNPAPLDPASFPQNTRTIDGTNNNSTHPDWGSANVTFLRLAEAAYADGSDAPSGTTRQSRSAGRDRRSRERCIGNGNHKRCQGNGFGRRYWQP